MFDDAHAEARASTAVESVTAELLGIDPGTHGAIMALARDVHAYQFARAGAEAAHARQDDEALLDYQRGAALSLDKILRQARDLLDSLDHDEHMRQG